MLAGFGFPFSFPDYPFYAASSHPVMPSSDEAFGPFRTRAESDQYRAVGDARSGGLTNDDPAFMSSRASTSVRLDPDTQVRTAEATARFDGLTTGPLALGQSLAKAKMTGAPGQAPTKESSFTLASFTIAGVQIAMTEEGFRLGDQAAPTADLSSLFGVLAQAGIVVEFLPARETETSIDSAGMRITRAGADPTGTQHKVALVLGRVSTSIQGASSPTILDAPTVAEDEPAPAATNSPDGTDLPAPVDGDFLDSACPRSLPSTTPRRGATFRSRAGRRRRPLPPPPPVTQLASPATSMPVEDPDLTGLYVALFAAALVIATGTRLLAASGVKLCMSRGATTEPSVSVLRLPWR